MGGPAQWNSRSKHAAGVKDGNFLTALMMTRVGQVLGELVEHWREGPHRAIVMICA
jgi:hypothetical protein